MRRKKRAAGDVQHLGRAREDGDTGA